MLNFTSDSGSIETWANLLATHGCAQLASGLLEKGGLGPQGESTGSLNGFHLDNPYVQAISTLVDASLQGMGSEVVRRTVDITLAGAGISVELSERDALAHMMNEGMF